MGFNFAGFMQGLSQASNRLPEAFRERALMQRQEQMDQQNLQHRQKMEDMNRAQLVLKPIIGQIDIYNNMMETAVKEGQTEMVPIIEGKLQDLQRQAEVIMRPFTAQPQPLERVLQRGAQDALRAPQQPLAPNSGDIPTQPDTPSIAPTEGVAPSSLSPTPMDSVAMRLTRGVRSRKDQEKSDRVFIDALKAAEGVTQQESSVDAGINYMRGLVPDLTPDQEKRARGALAGVGVPSGTEEAGAILDPEMARGMARFIATHPNAPMILQGLSRKDKVEVFKAMREEGIIPESSIPMEVVNKLTDFDTAMYDLSNVTGLVNERPDLFGPVAGYVYPMLYRTKVSEDAQNAMAQLDLTRQVVGKALEGGVLRKEDEIKYKKILGELTNQPGVALHKTRLLIQGLKFQRDRYLDYVKMAGKWLDPERLQSPTLPFDPQKSDLSELAFWGEQWPEAIDAIKQRFPEEWAKMKGGD